MNPPNPPPPAPSPAEIDALRRRLLDHYDRHARDLPWRRETDPYRIWVSEVMLQQTRVETVLGFYGSWLERFPDVDALARADRDEVLRAWEGLGYYRRARNLHEAAKVVRERHGGAVPSGCAELRALPGLGEYTAGAVASIAFGEVVPAVDGNVRRVLSRLLDVADPKPAWLRSVARELVDPERPGDWNQALMELGATVCTPRAPRCGACPWSERCRARAAGTVDRRPAPAARKPVPSALFAVAVVVEAGGDTLLVRRPEGGLLGGMWAFPEEPLEEGADPAGAARRAARKVGAVLGPAEPLELASVRHRFTHLAATYRPVVLEGRRGELSHGRWVPLSDPGVPLPVAQQKIVGSVIEHRDDARSRT